MDSSQNKKSKVLIIITQSEMGGAQRFLIQMIKGLGADFDFEIAFGSDGSGEINSHLPSSLPIHTIKSLKRNISPLDDLRSLSEIKDLIIAIKPVKVFLMSSKAGFNTSLANMLVDRAVRPKIIYRIGGWAFNDPGSILKKALYFGLEFISAPFKDVIIVNSLHDFKQARRWHIKPKSTLELVHNGLSLKDDDFLSKEEARQELGLNLNNFTIGCIANFYETKGLDILVKSINKIRDRNIKCVIIGDGKLRPVLEKQIRQLNLQDKILLVGKRDNAYRYLKAFDIYLSPSRKEGFAWAILEAMDAGLPVIATSVGSAPEMIEDGVNGLLIAPNDSDALASAIQSLLDKSEDALKALGENAKATAHTKFSETQMLEKIRNILEI